MIVSFDHVLCICLMVWLVWFNEVEGKRRLTLGMMTVFWFECSVLPITHNRGSVTHKFEF